MNALAKMPRVLPTEADAGAPRGVARLAKHRR